LVGEKNKVKININGNNIIQRITTAVSSNNFIIFFTAPPPACK